MLRLLAYTWFGMVLGVSFLATPIKFHAFGRVEWVLAVGLVLIALGAWTANHL